MKSLLIKQSALAQFVEKGYEGASLTDIVEEVGIKKQSIYSHFKHKEDLFLQVMNQVVQEEIAFLKDFFHANQHQRLKDQLIGLIMRYKERYVEKEDNNIKFMLRMAFMPPRALQQVVQEHFNAYYSELEGLIKFSFLQAEELHVSAEEGTISFLNFLDGILVELIYASVEKFDVRFQVSWNVYWRGIAK